jgi:hypothetical protein
MSIGAAFTQLVLFDGINIKDEEWSDKVKDLSEIPSSCKFWIFCDADDTFVEKSLTPFKNSQICCHKTSDPETQIFDILHDACFTYSFILIVYDKNASYARNLNKITKKFKHTCIMPMDPCNISVKDIIQKINYQRVQAPGFNHRRSAAAVYSKDDVRQHAEKKGDPQTNKDDGQPDHLKKMSDNKNRRFGGDYSNGLYCLVCGKSFHSQDDQNRHIKEGHRAAKSDDEDDLMDY